MSSEEIRQLWSFEQEFQRSHHPTAMVHADIFKALVEPNFVSRIPDWHNFCLDRHIEASRHDLTPLEVEALRSEKACRTLCIRDEKCLQYSWEPRSCSLGNVIRLGLRKTRTDRWISP